MPLLTREAAYRSNNNRVIRQSEVAPHLAPFRVTLESVHIDAGVNDANTLLCGPSPEKLPLQRVGNGVDTMESRQRKVQVDPEVQQQFRPRPRVEPAFAGN